MKNTRREGNHSTDVLRNQDEISSWCHTGAVRTKDFTHRWTIHDFEQKTRSFKPGESLSSNMFSLGGNFAVIKIFPNGTVGNKNHVSIFLENKGDVSLHISEIDFTFVPCNNSSPLSWIAPRKDLDPDDDWGFQRFVSVPKLKEKKLISNDGTLEIFTKITREQLSNNVSLETSGDNDGRLGVGEELWRMYKAGYMTDYTLHCDGIVFPCHKFILGSRSEFFRGLLNTELAECDSDKFSVKDIGSNTLHLVLEFLYTGGIQDSPTDLGEEEVELLMAASDFYVVPGLKALCEEWLAHTVNTENMVDRLILGDTYSAFQLRAVAKDMLIDNSKKLELIPDWKRKLATRTELVLEVLEELAKNSL